MARKPGDSRPDNAPEKLAMPEEASVLDYINSCAVPPSLRDIIRAFKIGQDQRASMRRLLRDMAERGILAVDRSGIAAPDTLPEVAVLELIDFDDNGEHSRFFFLRLARAPRSVLSPRAAPLTATPQATSPPTTSPSSS